MPSEECKKPKNVTLRIYNTLVSLVTKNIETIAHFDAVKPLINISTWSENADSTFKAVVCCNVEYHYTEKFFQFCVLMFIKVGAKLLETP